MGKLEFKFYKDKSEHNTHPVSYLYRKYNLTRIQQLEFKGNDLTISFELSELDNDEIVWENLSFPNPNIIKKIKEIIYYNEKENELDEIMDKIRRLKYDKRYEMKNLAKKALEIILDIKESEFFNIEVDKNRIPQLFGQTIREEINSLNNIRYNRPHSYKEKQLLAAKERLLTDIISFTSTLKFYSDK